MAQIWDGEKFIEVPELVVTWDTHDPGANKWKHLCKIIGHSWKPSHPHWTYCNRCEMGGWQHYYGDVEGEE